MSISEQVKELGEWANCVHATGHNYEILNQAADTIETLQTELIKLQTTNTDQSGSNDLIDRKKVLSVITPRLNSSEIGSLEYQRLYSISEEIKNMPVAYDVNKVLAQMDDMIESTEEYRHKFCETVTDEHCNEYRTCEDCLADQFAKIVKSGGT